MAHAQSRMPALFDVSLWAAETVNQEIAQALLGCNKIVWRVHRTQDTVSGYSSVECRNQPRDSGLTDQVVYVNFLQSLVTTRLQLSQTVWNFFRFL
jgi:hypothetical protein